MSNTTDLTTFHNFFNYISRRTSKVNLDFTDCISIMNFDLKTNVKDFTKFHNTLEHLITKNLSILVPNRFYLEYQNLRKNYTLDALYTNYVIPLALFMHYYEVKVKSIYKIYIWVIPAKMYDKYSENQQGGYFNGVDHNTKKNVHSIFIKEYPETDSCVYNRRSIVNSLFHELTHLLDSLDFKGFDDTLIIEYKLRWNEIKARYNAHLFSELYDKMQLSITDSISNTVLSMDLNIRCSNLDDLWIKIRNLSNAHDLKYNATGIKWLKESVQYTHSMQVIEDLQLTYYKIIEEL